MDGDHTRAETEQEDWGQQHRCVETWTTGSELDSVKTVEALDAAYTGAIRLSQRTGRVGAGAEPDLHLSQFEPDQRCIVTCDAAST
jgi:hypothetical protein